MADHELIKFRKRYNLSREDVASRLGVSAQTIWRWEKGIIKSPHKVLWDKLEKIMQDYLSQ